MSEHKLKIENKDNSTKKHLNWYQLSIIASVIYLAGVFVGLKSVIGSMIVLLAILLYLFSSAAATRSGLNGKTFDKKVGVASKVGYFILVLVINFIIYGILVQIFKSTTV